MKKLRGLTYLFLLSLFIVLSANLVIAPNEEVIGGEMANIEKELAQCKNECIGTYSTEIDRSPCIRKCKQAFEFRTDEYKEKDDYFMTTSEKEDEEINEEIFEEYEDAVLEQNAGTTPDHPLYIIDKFFDNFKDDLAVREERIAEVKQMIEEGKIEHAREALENYNELAEKLGEEVEPNRRDDALRSASAIKNAMEDIQEKIPVGERNEFVKNVIKQEHSIATSAEIANKINSLCAELSELDPELFYQTCRVSDEGPKWQKRMYKDLSEEQKREAKKFANIMQRCFRTSGQDCDCGAIPFPEFAKVCSLASPLVTACDIDRDENACIKLDNLDMPELPPHLQEVMDELEGKVKKEKFDIHMPYECREAGATTPDECGRIMITLHSPPECREALLAANPRSEREGRMICDKIMMEKHAPECVEQGITDPEECNDFMWNIENRPEECKKQGIHDFNDCQRFLESGPEHFGGQQMGGPMINFDCKSISDPIERLDCFDKASSGFGDYEERFRETKEEERRCADMCHREGRGWDFSNGKCECIGEKMEYDQRDPDMERKCSEECNSKGLGWDLLGGYCKCIGGYNPYEEPIEGCGDCASKCPGSSGTNCINNRCECYYESEIEHYPMAQEEEYYDEPKCGDCASECPQTSGTQELSGTDCIDGQCKCYYSEQTPIVDDYVSPTEDTTSTDTRTIEDEDTSSDTTDETRTTDTGTTEETTEDTTDNAADVTGSVINPFLDYYN